MGIDANHAYIYIWFWTHPKCPQTRQERCTVLENHALEEVLRTGTRKLPLKSEKATFYRTRSKI